MICCCSAYGEISFQKSALDSGMDHFLVKPLAMQEIKTLLDGLQINRRSEQYFD